MMKVFQRWGLFAALIALTGCTTFNNVREVEKKAAADAAANIQRIKNEKDSAVASAAPVRYLDKQWVSLKPMPPKPIQAERAPKCTLTKIATAEPITIMEFGQIVTKYCGVQVRVTPDALSAIESPWSADSTNQTTATSSPASTVPSSGVPLSGPMALSGVRAAQSATPDQSKLVDVNYSGELSGLLDMVVAKFGLSWRVEDGRIIIYNLETRTYSIHAINSDTDLKSEVQSGMTSTNGTSGAGTTNGGVGGTSGSMQSTSVAIKSSIYSDIKAALDAMKSPKGKVVISPSTGTVIVTDNAEVQSRVAKFVTTENQKFIKSVRFNIKILVVTQSNSDGLGVSWDAVWKTLSGKGFSLGGSFDAVAGSMSAGFSVLSSSTSPWAGSKAVIDALSEQADVRVAREAPALTLNLRPVAIQVARQDGYLAGGTTTTTASVGTSNTIQQGMITTGFNMSLLPYVMEDNRMLLAFSVNLSNLRNIRTVKSGDAVAEIPQMDLPINSAQQVRLSPGETLMLSGFDQEDDSATRTGTFTPENPLFGGGVKSSRSRSTLVVLITPTVVE